MTRATRLPLHPRPLPHEALSSWIDRLAAAYRLERHEFLRAVLGADLPPASADLDSGERAELAATFADRTGVPLGRVRAMTLAGYVPALIEVAEPSPGLFEAYAGRFGWLMPPVRRRGTRSESSKAWLPWRADDLLDVVPRGCRRCLVEDAEPYVRLHWRLAWMASCPLHGEMLVPVFAWPSLLRLQPEREPDRAAPDLVALDRITLSAVTSGTAMLPPGDGVIAGAAWLCALRSLIDELTRPVSKIGRWARDEVAAAWLRAGSDLNARQGWVRIPFECLLPEQRALLLRVAGAAVQHMIVRPARQGAGTALSACVAQWSGTEVYGT